jgi:hypothetical protein
LTPEGEPGNASAEVLPIFGNQPTVGQDMEAMAAGNSYLMINFLYPTQRYLLQNLSLYAQDTWRVNSRLNLTYGLRWDVDFAPGTEEGYPFFGLTDFSFTDLSNLGIASAGTPVYSTKYGNIAPRVGAAYQLNTNPNWGQVLRTGFGIFYGLASTELLGFDSTAGYYPLGANAYYSNVTFPTTPATAPLPAIVPPNASNGQTLFGFDPKLNLPYALEWNIAVEQSLGEAQTFTIGYIGAADRRLIASEDIANPNANFASAFLVANAATSNYQALQTQFRRSLSRGLQALISYTWSHSIDEGSYGAYDNGGFTAISANRASSDSDFRHVFSTAVTYEPPAMKKIAVTRALTGGWSLDDILTIRSGQPIDIIDENFTGLEHENLTAVIHPDVVPGQPFYLTGPQYPGRKALNISAFQNPPTVNDPVLGPVPTRQGNLGRNALRALGLKQWDFAVHRDFHIYDSLKLQFRGELFNIVNHPNFAPFNNQFQTNGSNPYFGVATEMQSQFLGTVSGQNPLYTPGGPRSGELALKLVF